MGDFTVWLRRKRYPQISLVWVTEGSAAHMAEHFTMAVLEELLNKMPPDHYTEIYGMEDKWEKT